MVFIPEDAEELERVGVEATEEERWRRRMMRKVTYMWLECPKCGATDIDIFANYCPECGASLKGVKPKSREKEASE